jgi:hypothetical protein
MTFRVEMLSPYDWTEFAQTAHMICFGEHLPEDFAKIDFALVVYDESNSMCGYATCKEFDKETVYLQHGGTFPNYEKSHYVFMGYMQILLRLSEMYKFSVTRIENKNVSYLKLALKAGFLVNGAITVKNKIYLNLLKDYYGG